MPDRPWSPPPPTGAVQAPTAVPVAWLGRTSTEDQQDPTLSLPRQLRNARAALPPGWVIVAHFYDVESGRKDLADRGNSDAYSRFDIPIPRDGSIADLLAEAERPDRRFAAVICESIERVARRMYFGTKIEHQLEQAGVALCAADEPIVTGPHAKRSTPTLTRRVKQAVAEWYVLQMLELSWDGFIEHTQQGWNTGKPPYGYLAEKVAHPVPARSAIGDTKHRLVPDPVRGPVVTEIFHLRCLVGMGYDAIAEKLNVNLAAYPPPQPTRAGMALGRWSGGAVREVLRNPKYTGYQVWNRRATKKGGRCNPPSEWVWSPRPTHEPLVTKELFDAAAPVAKHRERSRSISGMNSHPAARRTYRLRSYVHCTLCDRRMFGKMGRGNVYYACQKDPNQHSDAPWYSDHPVSVLVREDLLISAVSRFFAQRVYGPDRRFFLAEDVAKELGGVTPADTRDRERASLEEAIAATERKQSRLIQSLALGFNGDQTAAEEFDQAEEIAFRNAIRKEHAALTKQHQELKNQLVALLSADAVPDLGGRELLEALPHLDLTVDSLPEEEQRILFDAFNLELRYNRHTQELALQVVIARHSIERLSAISSDVANRATGRSSAPGRAGGEAVGGRDTDRPEWPVSVGSVVCPRQDSNLRHRL